MSTPKRRKRAAGVKPKVVEEVKEVTPVVEEVKETVEVEVAKPKKVTRKSRSKSKS